MTDEETKTLVGRYEMDSGIAYDLSLEELQTLLQEVGEMEPIIDAINVISGASVEQRAIDIGCSTYHFSKWEDDEPIGPATLWEQYI